jgi:uncharacterized sulfatase
LEWKYDIPFYKHIAISYYTGIDQAAVWKGEKESVRDHVLCEMHHSPEIVHLKTYINEQFKITVYNNQHYGELFDLKNDPGEHQNLWNDPNYFQIKSNLLIKFVQAEFKKDFAYSHPMQT